MNSYVVGSQEADTKDTLIKIYVSLQGFLFLSVTCSVYALSEWGKECPGVTAGCAVHFSSSCVVLADTL